MKLDGSWVDNQQVVLSIRHLLDVEFNALGYEYITYELKKSTSSIRKTGPPERVYRLMQAHNLLLGKMI
ncbi:hypothetical protein GCM10028805_26250 [Spirosoma harenae]